MRRIKCLCDDNFIYFAVADKDGIMIRRFPALESELVAEVGGEVPSDWDFLQEEFRNPEESF